MHPSTTGHCHPNTCFFLKNMLIYCGCFLQFFSLFTINLEVYSMDMLRIVTLLLASSVVFPAHAIPIIDVYTYVAPGAISPTKFTTAENAVSCIYLGLPTCGVPGPGQYQQNNIVTTADTISTNVHSWEGQINPGVTFGPDYTNEYGNMLAFGALVNGGGELISASQLSASATSNVPFSQLNVAPVGGFSYSSITWGILFGLDGILGGVDDTILTSGGSDTLVNAIVTAGIGDYFNLNFIGTPSAQQTGLNNFIASHNGPEIFTGTYTLAATSGPVSGSESFYLNGAQPPSTQVPEPSAIALFGIGLLGMTAVWKKKRNRPASVA